MWAVKCASGRYPTGRANSYQVSVYPRMLLNFVPIYSYIDIYPCSPPQQPSFLLQMPQTITFPPSYAFQQSVHIMVLCATYLYIKGMSTSADLTFSGHTARRRWSLPSPTIPKTTPLSLIKLFFFARDQCDAYAYINYNIILRAVVFWYSQTMYRSTSTTQFVYCRYICGIGKRQHCYYCISIA